MNFTATEVPHQQTGFFSTIVLDYLQEHPSLWPFVSHPATIKGIEAAIEARSQYGHPHRSLLVQALKNQYQAVPSNQRVANHIELLLQPNTFTICTAHQPAIFTGSLYFVYKILHTIKLAQQLQSNFPDKNFVPVFWMGSEDADLDELGKVHLNAQSIVWNTPQTGAVGKMNTEGLEKIIQRIAGELGVYPFSQELIQLLQTSYTPNRDIQTATFYLLHQLFAKYGLVVLIPDTAECKKIMTPVFEEDMVNHLPAAIVAQSINTLHAAGYKAQAHPRNINLFYLKDNTRSRIEKKENSFVVVGTDWQFSTASLQKELQLHPERFSPNVILRGLYQETLLPNIAFVGGGGELAYWLELKGLFNHYKVPFPVLVLRNSFLIVEKKWQEKINRLNVDAADLFLPTEQLLTQWVKEKMKDRIDMKEELGASATFYQQLKQKAGGIDSTLLQHVEALQAKANKPLKALEKKMLQAEKRKYETEQRQLNTLKNNLFPLQSLQERVENFMPYYAKWGSHFIECLLQHSKALEQSFTVLQEE
jgi:bacillithiol synthase